MTLVKAIRRLQRRPILLALPLVLACAVGYLMVRSTSNVGIASAAALVDSPKSQIADLGASSGTDVGTLGFRASLLASLMATAPIKDEIAREAGIPTADLIAIGPATIPGTNPAGSVVPATPPPGSASNTLTVTVPTLSTGQIPVIQVNGQSPTPAIAAKLANAAFTSLQAYLSSLASSGNISVQQRVVIRTLGPAAAAQATQGPGLILAAVGSIVVFLLACAAILGIGSMRAALRKEAALEDASLDPQAPEESLEQPPAGWPTPIPTGAAPVDTDVAPIEYVQRSAAPAAPRRAWLRQPRGGPKPVVIESHDGQ